MNDARSDEITKKVVALPPLEERRLGKGSSGVGLYKGDPWYVARAVGISMEEYRRWIESITGPTKPSWFSKLFTRKPKPKKDKVEKTETPVAT